MTHALETAGCTWRSATTRLLRPDADSSRVFGVDVWSEPGRAKALMGVLPDGLALPEQLTGRELLTYIGQLRGLDPAAVVGRADELLDEADHRPLGRAAQRQLARRGPELLQLMRSGKAPAEAATAPAVVWLAVSVGMIALFPQAMVPAVMKLSGDIARVWFLALYMPGPLQWPTIAFMATLGIGALVVAARAYAAAR